LERGRVWRMRAACELCAHNTPCAAMCATRTETGSAGFSAPAAVIWPDQLTGGAQSTKDVLRLVATTRCPNTVYKRNERLHVRGELLHLQKGSRWGGGGGIYQVWASSESRRSLRFTETILRACRNSNHAHADATAVTDLQPLRAVAPILVGYEGKAHDSAPHAPHTLQDRLDLPLHGLHVGRHAARCVHHETQVDVVRLGDRLQRRVEVAL
jgi:hypothetical protein